MQNNRVKDKGYVALLLPELRIGGAQKVFLTLAKEFIARGLLVDLVLLSEEGELLTEIPEGVHLVSLGQKPLTGEVKSLISSTINLVKYLRKNRPDALLSTLTGTNLLAVMSRSLSFVPFRLVLREAAPLVNLRHPWMRTLMHCLYRKADTVVVLTEVMKKEMEEKLQLPPHKILKLPNPIDLLKIEQDAAKPLPTDFETKYPYAVSVGRLTPQKDYMTLLNAFAKVTQTSALRLVVLGEGPDRVALETHARSLSLTDRVEFRGFDSNPYRWIARASVFVLSSRWEGYPNVLLEALALGIPVVSTCYDVSAHDLITDQSGSLVPVGDDSALAEAIRRSLVSFPPLNAKLPTEVVNSSLGYLESLGLL